MNSRCVLLNVQCTQQYTLLKEEEKKRRKETFKSFDRWKLEVNKETICKVSSCAPLSFQLNEQ